jgi:hypothetical protein
LFYDVAMAIYVRDLSEYRGGIVSGPMIELGVRTETLLLPDPENKPIKVELDLAVKLPDDTGALIIASFKLLELGLVPAISLDLVIHLREVAPLMLWLLPPVKPTTLEMGAPVANLVFLPLSINKIYHADLEIKEVNEEESFLLDFDAIN